MKKTFFLLFTLMLVLMSCGDNAEKVNKGIIDEVGKINTTMGLISQAISDDKYESAKVLIDSLPAQVGYSTAAIQLFNNKKAGAYKQAAIDYIAFVGKQCPAVYTQAIDIFEAAKIREQADVASGKQSSSMINSGPDFDKGRKLLKNFRIELKKVQEVLFEKQEKFVTANGLK